ncbi:hypothetical protein GQ457_07G010200 [Hibiscus cannabinus]
MRINPTTSVPGVSTLEKENLGRISQIIGPVLDVAFPPGKMPNIYNALVVKGRDTAATNFAIALLRRLLLVYCGILLHLRGIVGVGMGMLESHIPHCLGNQASMAIYNPLVSSLYCVIENKGELRAPPPTDRLGSVRFGSVR